MVARRGKTLVIGMPGYPAAFLTNAILYLVPALRKAAGRADFEHRPVGVELGSAMHGREGRLDANRARLAAGRDGRWVAHDPGSQTTSHFLNFAGADGLVLLPESVGDVPAGSRAEALLFDLELA
jgi:molybdopterin molybdotransferase